MYGEHGHEMLRLFLMNPIKAIPVLYDRFSLNYTVGEVERKENLTSWKEQCEKNFIKSLDHRSFHFKHHEKKHQQAKNYLNEIKTIAQMGTRSKSWQ